MNDASDPELADVLRAYRAAEPGQERLRRMSSVFEAQLEPSAAPGTPTGAPLRVLGLITVVGLAVGLAAPSAVQPSARPGVPSRAVVAVAATAEVDPPEDEPVERAQPVQPIQTPLLAEPGPEPEPPPSAVPVDASAAAKPRVRSPRRRQTKRVGPREAKVESVAVVSHDTPAHGPDEELRLIKTLRRALSSRDFDQAEILVARHERRFAAGLFVEERLALAVESACEAGDPVGARSRYRKFSTSFPRSAFLARARRCLDR